MTIVEALTPNVEILPRPFIVVNVRGLKLGNGTVLNGRMLRQAYRLEGPDGERLYHIYRAMNGTALGYVEVPL
jgi:hypothetical protein